MSTSLIITATFISFLVLFTAVGILSARKMKTTSEDYLVASRGVNPWLVALSAVSTNNSGYMFIGLIGFTWRMGVEAVWITFGWILGDLLTWFWVHRRVRDRSEAVSANSVPALLATDDNGKVNRPIAIAAGLLTFIFLGGYAAAQLKAGGITLNALFDWPIWLGSVMGVVIVAVYSMSGGIRASIWTDAVQSIVMVGAMTTLVGICYMQVGGPVPLLAALDGIDPKLIELFPRDLSLGIGLYAIGFVFAGMGTIGQPHILVRFMAIDDSANIGKARNIYFGWYIFFSLMAMAVGLYARVLMPDLAAGLSGDAFTMASEGALPQLAVQVMPPVLIGVMLAGLFAATMSTADSQILSCSAAITQDISPRFKESYSASKIATLAVAGVALLIALGASASVFSLVLVAWSALAASLGPVLLVRLAKQPLPTWLALLMMGTGVAVVFAWGASPWSDSVFKALPGILAPVILYGIYWVTAGRGHAAKPVETP
ncbi:MAG: sodium/proline symporter [Cognaticolwellia sp.]|jgi:sodium/proline symporter